jgi:hypothetical protein
MCEYPVCLHLRGYLNAAFRGEPLQAQTPVGAWVLGFMEALKKLPPEASYPYGFIWYLANGILLSMYSSCPCDGLIEHISCNPEAFLRSVLLVAKMHCSEHQGPFGPPASLH